MRSTFLSTPPSRVATWWRYPPAARLTCFYPRHPRGWRLRGIAEPSHIHSVSIHATLAGGDLEGTAKRTAWFVSIHATLAGGDPTILCLNTPYIVSIHATLAGGDCIGETAKNVCIVSIHATLAGGDTGKVVDKVPPIGFLSTPPSRVATP